MQWLDWIQWPAMVLTILAAWLAASAREPRRGAGFWCFLGSNALWVVWGWQAAAWALVVLQFALAGMNIRGVRNNDPASGQD
jgi:hypothetical protein